VVEEEKALASDKKRKDRKRSPWFDIFDEIKKLEKMMDDLMKSLESSNRHSRWHRPTYGFSAAFTRNKRPIIRRFKSYKRSYLDSEIKGEYEPLIDVFDEKDGVRVIVEVLGAEKDDIDIYATEESLTISIHKDDIKFYKEIPLPARVDPKTAVATCKNGVLAVHLKKTTDGKLFGGQKVFVK
jgi:HSP20 family protein